MNLDDLTFSPNQRAVLAHAVNDKTSVFAGGATRSGKSFGAMVSFAIFLCRQKQTYDHLLAGLTIESVMRNLGYDLIVFLNAIDGVTATHTSYVGSRIVVDNGKALQTVWVCGAGDLKRSRERIQGATFMGCVLDELTILPRDFFFYAWSRMSETGCKLWATFNPESPSHYVLREIINEKEKFDGDVYSFRLRDNPTLDEKTIKRFESSFTGIFLERFIQGRWCSATGNCFPHWEVTEASAHKPCRWLFAMDWACSGTLAVLAISVQGRRAIVAHELTHNGALEGALTDAETVSRLGQWYRTLDINKAPTGTIIYVDPSCPSGFKKLLRIGGWQVRNADNRVDVGVMTTAGVLARGEVKINFRCVNLLREIENYTWSQHHAELGKDKPTESCEDHHVDALRYFVQSDLARTGLLAKPIRLRSVLCR